MEEEERVQQYGTCCVTAQQGHKWQIRISTLGEPSKLRDTEFANQKAEPGEKIKLKRGSMKMKTRERYKG